MKLDDENVNVDEVLRDVYSSPEKDINAQIELFESIYQLKRLEFKWTSDTEAWINESFYKYASKVQHFVILALYSYDLHKRLFFIHSADTGVVEASLPGGAIGPGRTIQETIQHLARRCHRDVRLAEVEPLAVVSHEFRYRNAVHVQRGLACMARVANFDAIRREVQSFEKIDRIQLDNIRRFSNRDICDLAIKRLRGLTKSPGVDIEIESQERHSRRYQLHQRVVKPVFDRLKRSDKVVDKLYAAIGSSKRILDASCGDCETLISFAEQRDCLCVGNDVAWSQILSLMQRVRHAPADLRFRLVFTNHDIAELPFAEKFFDVAICKNTLHHFREPNDFLRAMASMSRVSRRLIVIDIEDPLSSGIPQRAVNAYYRRFLGDVGDKFLRFEQFRKLISGWSFKAGASCKIERIRSLWGNWMFAIIDIPGASAQLSEEQGNLPQA